jgi:hypothetical protein
MLREAFGLWPIATLNFATPLNYRTVSGSDRMLHSTGRLARRGYD